MKLYMHPASPNCAAVIVAAQQLGLELEMVFVDLMAGEQLKPEFQAINPNRAVPVLCDADFVLWETTAILQYLAAKAGDRQLWPDSARHRADIARWQSWGQSHWIPALLPFVFENFFKAMRGLGEEADSSALERARPTFDRYAAILDHQLARGAHLVGPSLTLADISVVSYLTYAMPARIPLTGYPNISRWATTVLDLPGWPSPLAAS